VYGRFERINNLAAARLAAGEPVISVDCNKTELVDRRQVNAGREWHLEGNPGRVGRRARGSGQEHP